jgi:hypothetical protein
VRLGLVGWDEIGDGDVLCLHCVEGLLGRDEGNIGLRDGVDGTSGLPLLHD